jgi:hypothetical protein
MTAQMSKSEREDLQRLVRQREKVLKSAAKQRSVELIADFENQMGQEYSFDQDEVWEQAQGIVRAEIKKANALIASRCRQLGIPQRFAPSIGSYWIDRGFDNMVEPRRKELRRMAQTQIEAIEQKAIVEIELSCLKAQEQIALAGLTTEVAKLFVERLPSIETLMPKLSFAEVAGDAEPPVAEQLVSSNALRQRRFRERLKRNGNVQPALRDASVTAASASDEPDGGAAP